MVLSGVVWRCEQAEGLGFDLRGQGQGRWPEFVTFERRQQIAGMWIENVASGATFRCECNANFGFYLRGQGQQPGMAKI